MEKINVDMLNTEKKDKTMDVFQDSQEKPGKEKNIILEDNVLSEKEFAKMSLKDADKSSGKEKKEEKSRKILLDENLMPKTDEEEAAETESKTEEKDALKKEKTEKQKKSLFRRESSEAKHSKRAKSAEQMEAFDFNDVDDEEADNVSILEGLNEKLENISAWFAEKFEQLMELFREPTNELELYKYKVRKERILRILKITAVVAIVLAVSFGTKYAVEHHTYSEYTVLSVSEKVDTGVSHFVELDGKILHYSADGASLTSMADELIWTDSYQMSQPVVKTFGSVAAIYDLKGSQIFVYDGKGRLGSFQTNYPIIKASVSAKGEVAVILENGENTLINYYTETGSLIASSSTNMRNPGYPVDLAVSKDGLSVAVTYFVTDEDTISSYLAFYNFGDAGRKKEDNLLGGVRCAGVLVPEIQYLDNNRVIAYSENGFKLFKVKNEPEAVKEVIFEEDIVSSFGDGNYIGFIFQNETSQDMFLMRLYDTSGNLKMETTFDLAYDAVKISDDKIVLNNATQMAVYSLKGIEKYSGTIEEGKIHEIVKVGINKYTVAYNGGVMTIKLK